MIEQQQHLVNLVNQRESLVGEISSLQDQMNKKRELFLKVQGAIEYLQQIGTILPETVSETQTDEELEDGNEF